jgi:hypothetical protein
MFSLGILIDSQCPVMKMYTSDSTNIQENSVSFLGMSIGVIRICSVKKTGGKKSCVTPFILSQKKAALLLFAITVEGGPRK